MKRLEGRIALVTGASRGIGRATALACAREGAHVIALARTQGALEELDDEIRALGKTVTLVPLDLLDFAGIDRLGAALFQRHKKLDLLVAAAAELGPLSPLPHVKPEDFERTLAIDLTANYRLIRSLDPLLRASASACAIFLTGGVPEGAHAAYWGPYAAAKAALEAMVRSYAAEVAHAKVRVHLVDPGPTRTALRAKAFPGEAPSGLPKPKAAAEAIVELICAADAPESGTVIRLGRLAPR
ncbi:MAG: SDR family NAD(P)-dependent oxidoreductase [Alphaproteobacteria bacterium]|nr:SDR family NAD(P)-dependent oxidoreductase [Alphaproteobacteria bacterium]MBM3950068.1 SDR family NAD(P)-dependent oxidoreductase [Rhodospirillales bacterium]